MIPRVKPVKLKKGQFLFREGEKVNMLYFIKEGEFNIMKNVNLHTGEYF